jgi:hypothetical protein
MKQLSEQFTAEIEELFPSLDANSDFGYHEKTVTYHSFADMSAEQLVEKIEEWEHIQEVEDFLEDHMMDHLFIRHQTPLGDLVDLIEMASVALGRLAETNDATLRNSDWAAVE